MVLVAHFRASALTRSLLARSSGLALARVLAASIFVTLAAALWAVAGPGAADADAASRKPTYDQLVKQNKALARQVQSASAAVGGKGDLASRIRTVSWTLGHDSESNLLTQARQSALHKQVQTNKLTRLEATNKKLGTALATSTTRVDQLTRTVAARDRTVSTQAEEVSDLTTERTRLAEAVAALEQDNAALSSDVADRATTIDGLRASIATTEDDLAALTDRFGALAADNAALADQVDALTIARRALTDKVEALTGDKTQLQDELDGATDRVSALTEEKAALTDQIDILSTNNTALTGRVDILTNEKDALTGQVETLTTEKTSIQTELTTAKSDIATLTDRLDDLDTLAPRIVTALKSIPGIAQSDDAITMATNAKIVVVTRDNTIGNLNSQVGALNGHIGTLNTTITNGVSTTNYLSRFLQRNASQPATLPEALQVLRGILGA